MAYFQIFLVFFSFLFLFHYCFRNKDGLPTNWPILGYLPAILKNHRKIHDYITEVAPKVSLTLPVKGPSFTNMKILLTVDPLNVQHVMSKNFDNYPKGSKFKQIFEILGDGILNTDKEIWKYHRKMAQSLLALPQYNRFLVKKTLEKIEIGLIPILDHASDQGLEIDLQNLFERFTFDTLSSVILDHDPKTLSIDLPNIPISNALHDAETAIMYRCMIPMCVWKFMRLLCIGHEKKHMQAWKIIDRFLYEFIYIKKEDIRKNLQTKGSTTDNELGIDLMTLYMDHLSEDAPSGLNIDKVLRDTFLTFIIAGLETTSVALLWFFYNLSRHPHVLEKIKEELDAAMLQVEDYSDDHNNEIISYLSRNFNQLANKLTYLEAAVYESLRLYPPLAFQIKVPIEHDTLPSGHKIDPNTQVLFSTYAMGRMKSIWGEDCCEYKPERWISEIGKLRHEPSYKFMAFNSGPRTCPGKNMAMTQIKAVTIAMISKYRFHPVEEGPAILADSFVLHMKYGFKVKVHTK